MLICILSDLVDILDDGSLTPIVEQGEDDGEDVDFDPVPANDYNG